MEPDPPPCAQLLVDAERRRTDVLDELTSSIAASARRLRSEAIARGEAEERASKLEAALRLERAAGGRSPLNRSVYSNQGVEPVYVDLSV